MFVGGIYQLRQGQQRRIQVRVKPVQNSGTLPIICQSILNIAVGSVSVRNRLQIPLDSYQDEDLSILREKWSEALMRRRQYLDQQIQKLINKQGMIETCDTNSNPIELSIKQCMISVMQIKLNKI